jgi:hypothetical protein
MLHKQVNNLCPFRNKLRLASSAGFGKGSFSRMGLAKGWKGYWEEGRPRGLSAGRNQSLK